MNIKTTIVFIFITGFLLISLEVCLGFYYSSSDRKSLDKNTERIIETGVYKNVNKNTVKAIYQELRQHKTIWEPYVHYRLDSMNFNYSKTNKDGVRQTLNLNLKNNAKKNTNKPLKIACFGGSTMFGFGARDNYTIPSELSKIIYKNFPDAFIEVVNYGTQGYTRSMENIQYMNLILEQNPMDIAIFYDGANEVLSAFQSNKAGMPMNAYNRVTEFGITKNYKKRLKFVYQFSYTKRFITGLKNSLYKGSMYPKPNSRPDSLALQIASSYKDKVAMLANINSKNDTKIYNFLQPHLFSKTKNSKTEKKLKQDFSYYKNLFNIGYTTIVKDTTLKLNYNFHDLSHLFNNEKETIYTDFCHTAEYGNQLVAKHIFEIIKKDILDLKVAN